MAWKQELIVMEHHQLASPRPITDGSGKVIGWDVEELVNAATGAPLAPGDIYEERWYLDHFAETLSPYYFAHNAHRLPLVLVLPAPFHKRGSVHRFCVDSKATSGGELQPDGWTVTGYPPNLTVAPSINCFGIYHGFCQNGVLTDDCDGRLFPHHPPR